MANTAVKFKWLKKYNQATGGITVAIYSLICLCKRRILTVSVKPGIRQNINAKVILNSFNNGSGFGLVGGLLLLLVFVLLLFSFLIGVNKWDDKFPDHL